jgi:hypothetical protein
MYGIEKLEQIREILDDLQEEMIVDVSNKSLIEQINFLNNQLRKRDQKIQELESKLELYKSTVN